jgi:hypothetical protein
VKNELRREIALDYLKFRRNAIPSGWLSSLRSVDKPQVSFDTAEDEGADDEPFSIDELMKQLPEVVRIPLEQAVEDVELEGWEDDWFSSATYNFDNKIAEPKLDFVYNCESIVCDLGIVFDYYRGQWLGRRIQDHQTQIRACLTS